MGSFTYANYDPATEQAARYEGRLQSFTSLTQAPDPTKWPKEVQVIIAGLTYLTDGTQWNATGGGGLVTIDNCDMLVLGASFAGMMSAIEAAREGLIVHVVEEWDNLLGQVGNINYTDAATGLDASIHDRTAVGDFYRRVLSYLPVTQNIPALKKLTWLSWYSYATSPTACQKAITEMMAGLQIYVHLNEYISAGAITKTADYLGNLTVVSQVVTNKHVFKGIKVFHDATYEGDGLYRAGCDYVVGREGNAKSVTAGGLTVPSDPGATISGYNINAAAFAAGTTVNPYQVGSSGALLKGVWGDTGSVFTPVTDGSSSVPYDMRNYGYVQGDPDLNVNNAGNSPGWVPSFCYRLYLTTAASRINPNNLSVVNTYDPTNYAILSRVATQIGSGWTDVGNLFYSRQLNNSAYYDFNKGSSHGVGSGLTLNFTDPMCTEYITATHTRRAAIRQYIRDWTLGLWRFCSLGAIDPYIGGQTLPTACKSDFANYGFSSTDLIGTGGFPSQMYIREARRLVNSSYNLSQTVLLRALTGGNNGQGATNNDPCAITYYAQDGHNIMRIVPTAGTFSGSVAEEGGVGGATPTAGAWLSLKVTYPNPLQATNMFVSVCHAATHLSWCSTRVEPTLGYTGATVGKAAARFVARKLNRVQDLTDSNNYAADVVRAVNFFGDAYAPNGKSWDAYIDIDGGTQAAAYPVSGVSHGQGAVTLGLVTVTASQVFNIDNSPQGFAAALGNQAKIVPTLTVPGTYAVYAKWQCGNASPSTRSTRSPFTIRDTAGLRRVTFNQNLDIVVANNNVGDSGNYELLGYFEFDPSQGSAFGVNKGANGTAKTVSVSFTTVTFPASNIGGDYTITCIAYTDNNNYTLQVTDPRDTNIGTIVVAVGVITYFAVGGLAAGVTAAFSNGAISFVHTNTPAEAALNIVWTITIVNNAPYILFGYDDSQTSTVLKSFVMSFGFVRVQGSN